MIQRDEHSGQESASSAASALERIAGHRGSRQLWRIEPRIEISESSRVSKAARGLRGGAFEDYCRLFVAGSINLVA